MRAACEFLLMFVFVVVLADSTMLVHCHSLCLALCPTGFASGRPNGVGPREALQRITLIRGRGASDRAHEPLPPRAETGHDFSKTALQRITLIRGRGERARALNPLPPRARTVHDFSKTALKASPVNFICQLLVVSE